MKAPASNDWLDAGAFYIQHNVSLHKMSTPGVFLLISVC